jgi:hypothetical protein
MKKNLLFLAMAAVALASCSNDETTEVNQGEAISFRPLVNGMTRGATDAGLMTAFAADNEINVWADYDDDGDNETAVKKFFYDTYTFATSPSNSFSSTNKHYWPADVSATKDIAFYATYGGVTQTAGGVFAGFTPNSAVASQVDLLVAKTIRTSGAEGGAVVLNFRHALSQIAVKVKNTNPNLKFTVKEVRIGCISTAATAFSLAFDNSATNSDTQQENASGSLTSGANLISSSSWTITTAGITANGNKYDQDPSDLTFEGTTDVTGGGSIANAETTFGSSWILLPQSMKSFTTDNNDANSNKEYVTSQNGSATGDPDLSGSYIALKLTIDNWNGTAATGNIATDQWCYWPIDGLGSWTPGLKYTYTINMAGGGYYPQDKNSDYKLDQILNEIVISPSCTIDVWNAQSDAAVGM